MIEKVLSFLTIVRSETTGCLYVHPVRRLSRRVPISYQPGSTVGKHKKSPRGTGGFFVRVPMGGDQATLRRRAKPAAPRTISAKAVGSGTGSMPTSSQMSS